MTKAEVEKYLRRARFLQNEISSIKTRIQRIQNSEDEYSVIYRKYFDDGIPFEKLLILLDETVKKYESILDDVRKSINDLIDSRQRMVLSAYYIESLSVEEIAIELFCCDANIYKLINKGIQCLAEIMENAK